MIEINKDIFCIPCNWICILTNGIVKEDGSAVMGAGVALECAQKFWETPYRLGELLQKYGNKVHLLHQFTRDSYVPKVDTEKFYQMQSVAVSIYSFPTKHYFKDPSSALLIEESCKQILSKYKQKVFESKSAYSGSSFGCIIPKVVIPRAGTGCGGLNWERDVKPIFLKYFGELDDFIICYK